MLVQLTCVTAVTHRLNESLDDTFVGSPARTRRAKKIMSIHLMLSLPLVPAVFTFISPTSERTAEGDGWVSGLVTDFTNCVIHFVDDQLAQVVDYTQIRTPYLINAVGSFECSRSSIGNTNVSTPAGKNFLDWERQWNSREISFPKLRFTFCALKIIVTPELLALDCEMCGHLLENTFPLLPGGKLTFYDRTILILLYKNDAYREDFRTRDTIFRILPTFKANLPPLFVVNRPSEQGRIEGKFLCWYCLPYHPRAIYFKLVWIPISCKSTNRISCSQTMLDTMTRAIRGGLGVKWVFHASTLWALENRMLKRAVRCPKERLPFLTCASDDEEKAVPLFLFSKFNASKPLFSIVMISPNFPFVSFVATTAITTHATAFEPTGYDAEFRLITSTGVTVETENIAG